MAVDPNAQDFFRKQMDDPENTMCCDCNTEGAPWVSISHGIYVSIGAAGLHRSLGVKVSFVQSTLMDSWKPKHLRMMELGGNRKFKEFLEEHGIPLDMSIREKYRTRAAKWYRENLSALADGLEPLDPLPLGTGHLPVEAECSATELVLDKVFAKAGGSVTGGGIQHKQVSADDQKGVGSKADTTATTTSAESPGLCKRLAACFKLSSRSSGHDLVMQSSPRSKDFSDATLDQSIEVVSRPTLLGSTSCPTADMLKKMSSGKMEGFGS